jgi:hypothetical protein
LIVGLLVNGVAYAAIFIVAAVLISRFAGEFVWRSFLVLFLFIAAGLYIVFAVRTGEGALWVVGELVGVAIFGGMADARPARLVVVDRRGMGFAPHLGCRAALSRTREILRSRNLHDRLPQLRPAGRRLHRHSLRTRTTQGPHNSAAIKLAIPLTSGEGATASRRALA